MFANALGGVMHFGRVPPKKDVLSDASDPASGPKDPASGPNAPHYEIIFGVSPRSYQLGQSHSDSSRSLPGRILASGR